MSVSRLIAVVAAVLASSCTRTNADFCDAETACGAGTVCDLTTNECESGACGSDVPRCSATGDSRFVCDDSGLAVMEEPCEFGCNETRIECNACEPGTQTCKTAGSEDQEQLCADDGTLTTTTCLLGCRSTQDECVDIQPSNDLDADLDFIDEFPNMVRDVVLEDGYGVNSDGVIDDNDNNPIEAVDSRSLNQPSGPSIRIFRVRSLTINGTVTFSGASPIAVVSDGDIVINGIVRVFSGTNSDRGQNNCVGEDTENDNGDKSGGGGGGFGRSVGNGGDADNANGGQGGNSHGNQQLVPLVAGCNGGRGLSGQTTAGAGGGGLQLVSRQIIRIPSGGSLSVAGSGGGYESVMGVAAAATGGGSGGGILLEAPVLDLVAGAFVSANGGGGGCELTFGEAGRLDRMAASGSNCSNPAGDGGDGGAAESIDAENGNDGSGTAATGGGGGGGVGRIRVNIAAGQDPSDSFFSPNPSTAVIGTR